MYLERVNSPDDLKKLSISELKLYAKEAREFLVKTVLKTGGHLASNLGAVELTVALHYVFDCPKDKFLFDVGHQSYIHKMITGRLRQMSKLRADDGISGFPSPLESDADTFMTGHSSTSISLALGLARARDLSGEDYKILPIIGDGSFTGGMVYEALNDIGQADVKLTIILNDNKMSISKNIGAISKYFTRLRLSRKYNIFRANVKKTLLPFFGDGENLTLKKAKGRVKEFFLASRLFENFGISYYGPVDGHNVAELVDIFRKVSLKDRPSIIHLVTQKGRGYAEAEESPDKFHSVAAAEKAIYFSAPPNTQQTENVDVQRDMRSFPTVKSFSVLAGDTLLKLAEKDDKVVAITAAMGLGTGLECFAKKFRDRYFDVSIAEQHAVSVAAGLAKGGYKPYFFVYSTFLQRGFDQILHEVSLGNFPVKFLIDRAGAVGNDGATHQGIFDFSYLSLIPNMTIMTPKDGTELAEMIKWSANFPHPLAIRYPKDYVTEYNVCTDMTPITYSKHGKTSSTKCPIEYGKWEVLKNCGSKVFLLAAGNRMIDLAHKIDNVNIINARFIKPLNREFLYKINKNGNLIITLEDNVLSGGFGQAVVSYLNAERSADISSINEAGAKIINFAHGDRHVNSRDVALSFKESGITEKDIKTAISRFFGGLPH